MINANANVIEKLKKAVADAERVLQLAEGLYAARTTKITERVLDEALRLYSEARKDLRQATKGYRQTFPHPCAFRRCSSRGKHLH